MPSPPRRPDAQGIYRGAMNEAHLALGEERRERSGAFTL
jgi:hypothetical protein